MRICVQAHEGQVDKAGLPYLLHPSIVADHVEGELETCVALLHDVVEDTAVTLDDLRGDMPAEVVDAVALLTHAPDVSYSDYIAAIKGNALARAVKLQDLAHNMDIGRIDSPTPADMERMAKYQEAYDFLSNDSNA